VYSCGVTATENALELVRASARYGHASTKPALEDVSLAVAPGEIVAILGPNGAGKSTLLRVLAGTLRAESGESLLFGASVCGRERGDVARDVAFVAQSEDVRFAFTVEEVVLMGRAPHQHGWMRPSEADVAIVRRVLERWELLPLARRPFDQLSGGERKRVAIARAFAQASRVLLLDEPTAFLDVRHQVALFEALRDLARGKGTASVVVTHDLQLAAEHASRVVLMKAGRVVAVGPTLEVLTAGRLEEAFDWPIAVGRLEGTGAHVFAPRRAVGSRALSSGDRSS